MDRPCGNPDCCTSTGIHDGITCGSGELDEFGYWEFPCEICARAVDAEAPALLEKYIQEQMGKGKTHEEATKFLRQQHLWLFLEAWPFPKTPA